jgi:hypothetical protein
MGSKRDKRRPGREAERDERPRRYRPVEATGFTVWVDSHTGDLTCWGDHTAVEVGDRNRVTGEVLELLAACGFPPRCGLEVRDFLFG